MWQEEVKWQEDTINVVKGTTSKEGSRDTRSFFVEAFDALLVRLAGQRRPSLWSR